MISGLIEHIKNISDIQIFIANVIAVGLPVLLYILYRFCNLKWAGNHWVALGLLFISVVAFLMGNIPFFREDKVVQYDLKNLCTGYKETAQPSLKDTPSKS